MAFKHEIAGTLAYIAFWAGITLGAAAGLALFGFEAADLKILSLCSLAASALFLAAMFWLIQLYPPEVRLAMNHARLLMRGALAEDRGMVEVLDTDGMPWLVNREKAGGT